MASPSYGVEPSVKGSGLFTTTHWSVVLAAGQSESPQAAQALERLCGTYWYPLYAYVRRQGHNPEDAQDLTQDFFAGCWRRASLAAQRQSGVSSVLTSSPHFATSWWTSTGTRTRPNAAEVSARFRWMNAGQKSGSAWSLNMT